MRYNTDTFFCQRVDDDVSFAHGMVPEGSVIMMISSATPATVCPIENSLEGVLRMELGKKLKPVSR